MTQHVTPAAPGPDAAATGPQPGRSGKPTSYARVTLSRIMTAVDVNLYGTVHGGVMVKFMDDVAGACAARHCGVTAVTAAIDEIAFLAPVRVGDLVHAHAQVNWTGRSSLEIGVRLVAERWDLAETQPIDVATAYLVFVAIDADGQPRPVRPVLPQTPEDERRWREAEIRRAHRLSRREAIQAYRGDPGIHQPAGAPDGPRSPGTR
jgi:acyl-CoA hydrolase